jgi:5-formaminoimidazole-4-carboxamide-1-(beta)-D-ribofuranosyl 5'-monophosphate synthetase
MINREEIWQVVDQYKPKKIAVGSIGSHSALDILDGAKDEEFNTYAWCEKGREEPYTRFFKSQYIKGKLVKGCVDNPIVLEKFKQMLEQQQYMKENNIVIVPNRAFTVYVGETEIEEQFKIPILGSRNMLRIEERGKRGEIEEGKISDYYSLCEAAGIATPKKLDNPDDIEKYGLVMVKLKHKQMHLERGFFTASSRKEFDEKANRLLTRDIITKEDLDKARIEQYILGPVMNFDFFYSPVSAKLGEEPLELLGIDWRFESNLDGLVRLPAAQQLEINEKMRDPLYVVVGHNSCTVRESILRFVFEMGEKFQKATQQYMAPGMIGAFCLQTIITPEMKPVVYDVAFRIGGGTNVHGWVGHNYGNLLWRQRMSSGRRTALELRRAIENDCLHEIIT